VSETPPYPHDLEAERAVLGCILLAPERLPEASGIVSVTDFYRQGHRDMFTAMRALHARGEAIDFVTLRTELAKLGKLEESDPVYMSQLTDGQTRSNNVALYAHIVRDFAAAREAIRLLQGHAQTLQRNPLAISNGLPAAHREAWDLIIARANTPSTPTVRAMTMVDIAGHIFTHRRGLLWRGDMPIVCEGHLAEVYALRGIGKTWFTTTLAIVAATGTDGLGFSAPEPCRVLQIDGEMAGEELKSRAATVRDVLNVLDTDNLTIVAADWQDGFLHRLDTPEGQAAVEPFVAEADLIVLDNRSTLFDPEGEKDPVAWQPAQDWLLSLRRRGKVAIVVHHGNRQGGARGHSKPEDVMNLLIKLSRPEDYRADQGARFTVEFEKTRGAHGPAVMPFTTQLTASGWLLGTLIPPGVPIPLQPSSGSTSGWQTPPARRPIPRTRPSERRR
jgi:hypothetical protein